MKIRWHHWLGVVLVGVLVSVGALVVMWNTGLAGLWMRQMLVSRIEKATGARVELGQFRFQLWGLRAELDNLTLHGREEKGLQPLFRAEKVQVSIRIVSFLGRKIALDELIVDKPEAMIRFDASGKSNVPSPPAGQTAGKPWREQLLDLQIGRLQLNNGSALVNDVRVPLAVEGDQLNFTLSLQAAPDVAGTYVGTLDWRGVDFTARRYLPFHSDISAKFALSRDTFSLGELKWKMPHSELDASAQLPTFERNDWEFKYRGRVALEDVRKILRKPTTPDGAVTLSGSASLARGDWTGAGHFDVNELDLPYEWFHANDLQTWGDYEVRNRQLFVPGLKACALGGTLDARLALDFDGPTFRVDSKLRGASLAAIFAALDNPNFPMHTLHWDSLVDVDAVNTWTADFKHFRSRGESRWSAPANLAPGKVPAEARIDYDYSEDRREAQLRKSEISTPTSRITMDGPLGAGDSSVELGFHADDLTNWDDFINNLLGTEREPHRIAGRTDWTGRVLGPLLGPTFAGHVQLVGARYDSLAWEKLDGELSYSPDELRLTNLTAQRGHSSASLDLWLQLDGNWSFLPKNQWNFQSRFARTATDDLQALFDTHFPLSGLLSGEFDGGGTHAAPHYDTNLALEDFATHGVHFDRLTGQLHIHDDVWQFLNADLRKDTSRVTGDFTYQPAAQSAEFNLTGNSIALEAIPEIQTKSLPIAGQFDFAIQGSGPLKAPRGNGTLKVRNLKLGSELQGDFTGKMNADGQRLQLALQSESNRGKLEGNLELGLAQEYPLTGNIQVQQFDLDPLIIAGLHLRDLTGHSSVDGQFNISGPVSYPSEIRVAAELSTVVFDYEFVKLQNDGPIRLEYRRNEVRIDQAHLRGPDTDLHFSGSARFDRDRPLNLALDGTLNLRLAAGLLPGLDARGAASVQTAVTGTMQNPNITGHIGLQDASAVYDDFPTGLSHVTGDIVFDKSQALFDKVTAEAGGGSLTLSGSMSYGDGPWRYQVDAVAPRVRIRYPEGMSWLTGGTLHLAGTADGAVLSGSVEVQRLLFAENVDMATLLSASQNSVHGPATTSTYLRNLQFDVEAHTTPGALMEWSGARVEMEGTMRLRGTWEQPILLGNIHLLNGQMSFRGNKYQLSRGDIVFSNPFRLDPVLNVEATTTISQYEITLDFTGPSSNLALAYRSDPPLPDSDIIALLALGSTGTESALRSSSAQTTQGYGATALLSEAISSQLGGRIERLFGISRFRVDPFLAGTATEQNAAARVTIEEQIGHKLTVTYSTNAASNQQQVIQVEYAVRRDISIIGLRDINGTFSLSVEFKSHFK